MVSDSLVGTSLNRVACRDRVGNSRYHAAEAGGIYLDIKRGAWTLERVKSESERLFELSREAYVRSPLPPEPDRGRAEHLCVEMISAYHEL